MATIQIKSTHPESQGEFVLIEAEHFDAALGHELFGAATAPTIEGQDGAEGAKKAGIAELREACAAKGIQIPEGAKKAGLQALLDATAAA